MRGAFLPGRAGTRCRCSGSSRRGFLRGSQHLWFTSLARSIAASFAYGLASCAVAPSGVDTASTKPDVAAAGTTPVAAVVPIAIRVVPSLREAVGRVFSEHPTFRGVVLVDEATGAAEYRIAL